MSSKWKSVIEKLLRKAEDPATPDVERDSLIDKATELMAKFGIEESVLFADKQETVQRDDYIVTNPHKLKKGLLLNNIAITFGCVAIALNDSNIMRVVGFKDDLEKVRTLYNSLLVQMFVSLNKSDKPANIHAKTFSDSFLKGFVITVVKRVRNAYNKAKEDVSRIHPGTDLVLRNRKEMVIKSVLDEFPHMRSNNTRVASRSTSAYSLGKDAGNKADIGQRRIDSQRRAIGGQ